MKSGSDSTLIVRYVFGDYANPDHEEALRSLQANGDVMSRCERLMVAVCAFSERVKALEARLETTDKRDNS
jgi:hypothetical protein